jgi:hypothetical protein
MRMEFSLTLLASGGPKCEEASRIAVTINSTQKLKIHTAILLSVSAIMHQ